LARPGREVDVDHHGVAGGPLRDPVMRDVLLDAA
jgi:hypothetical protein